jgi:hypothetical protein
VAKPANVLSDYLDEFELAEQLKHDVRTLRKWRRRCKGPAYVMIGRRAYYRLEAVRAWFREKEETSAA